MELISTLKSLQYDEITGDIVITDGKDCSCVGVSFVVTDPEQTHTVNFSREVDTATAQVYTIGEETKLIIPQKIEYTGSSATFTFYKRLTGDVRFTVIFGCDVEFGNLPDPTPTQTPTPTPDITPSGTPTPTPTQTVTPTPTVSLSNPAPSSTPDTSQTPTPSPTLSATPTPSPLIVVSLTPTPTATAAVTPSVTPTIAATPSVTPTVTPTVSVTPTITPTASPLPSQWQGIYSAHDFTGDVSQVLIDASGFAPDYTTLEGVYFDDFLFTESGGPGGAATITNVNPPDNGMRVSSTNPPGTYFGSTNTIDPTTVFETSGEMTIMFFVNIPAQTGTAGNSASRVVAIANNSNQTFGAGRTNGLYYDYVDGDDRLEWYNRNSINGEATVITSAFTSSPYNGTWTHFAQTITWGAGFGDTANHERVTYINGQVFDTTTGANTYPAFNDFAVLHLGGTTSNSTDVNFSTSYIRTFDRVLSQPEIDYHYNSGNGRPYLG